jgi:SAM-dependent methyltransferase
MFSRLKFNWAYWRRRAPWDTGITPPEIEAHLAATPTGRALDLGCGTGTNAIRLAQLGWRVSAVDFSDAAIAKARTKAESHDLAVDFYRASVAKLDFLADPFDFIYDIGCLHGLEPSNRQAYGRAVQRLLKRGGTYMLYTFCSDPDRPNWGLDQATLAKTFPHLKTIKREDGLNQGALADWASAWIWYKHADSDHEEQY